MTANGAVSARRITLAKRDRRRRHRLQRRGRRGAAAMPFVLLGNSFLSHFQMHSDSSTLVLEKKN
jgi:hypothetical protein